MDISTKSSETLYFYVDDIEEYALEVVEAIKHRSFIVTTSPLNLEWAITKTFEELPTNKQYNLVVISDKNMPLSQRDYAHFKGTQKVLESATNKYHKQIKNFFLIMRSTEVGIYQNETPDNEIKNMAPNIIYENEGKQIFKIHKDDGSIEKLEKFLKHCDDTFTKQT